MSTEHHVMSGPRNADSIHLISGATGLLVAVDSSCSCSGLSTPGSAPKTALAESAIQSLGDWKRPSMAAYLPMLKRAKSPAISQGSLNLGDSGWSYRTTCANLFGSSHNVTTYHKSVLAARAYWHFSSLASERAIATPLVLKGQSDRCHKVRPIRVLENAVVNCDPTRIGAQYIGGARAKHKSDIEFGQVPTVHAINCA
eukprot:668313-Amphidinium_carterae.3